MANQWVQYLYVATGGFGGAVSRHYFGILLSSRAEILPVGTLTVNLLGSGILGFFLTATMSYWKISPFLRLGIASGFLGSFTTYSTFSVDTLTLWNAGLYSTAVFYVLANFLGGFLFAYCGVRLAESIGRDEKAGEER